MSPNEALQRIKMPSHQFNGPKSILTTRQDHLDSIESIVSKIKATPDTTPRTQVRRLPSQALRWFVLTDVMGLLIGFAIAWFATYAINNIFFEREFASLSILAEKIRFAQFALVGAGVLLWLSHLGHYNTRMPFWFETQQIAKALCFALMIDGFFQFAAKQDFSRIWLASAWLFAGCSIVACRFITRRMMQKNGSWQLRTLLVGSGIIADETRTALHSESELGYSIVMQIENLPLLLKQASNSWEKLCDRFNADFVVIALDGHALADAGKEVAQLTREGIPFSVSPPLRHLPVLGMAPQYFFNHDVMLMTHRANLEQPLPRFMKRSLDIVGASVGLLILSPVMLTLAWLVKKDGGPIFYGDKRNGMKNVSFNCLKFRSMVTNSQDVLEQHLAQNPVQQNEWTRFHKLRNDPRVTKIGTFMRTWSLDELPQLINVLRGDMSLVGPRPINAAETKHYEEMAFYNKVRPGLTGLWQVSGRSNVSFARRIQMDSWYVRNWSLWHDLAILCKTIPAVIKKTGAS